MSDADKCKSCGKPIFFATTSRGNSMPVDPEPSEFGNLLLGKENGKPVVDVITGATLVRYRAMRMELYLSHFKTCPDAAAWRGGQFPK
jgi:hypothetical protein